MKAHVIENGFVVNTIEVETLDFLPNLVDASAGGIGWTYSGGVFSAPVVALSNEEKAQIARTTRNALLSESDWTQAKDIPDSISIPWATYRQALRDIPQQAGFPETVVWPEKP